MIFLFLWSGSMGSRRNNSMVEAWDGVTNVPGVKHAHT